MTAHRLTLVDSETLDQTILCWLPWAVLVRSRDGIKWIRRRQ